MTESNDVKIDYQRVGRAGRIAITVRIGGVPAFTDKIDVTSDKARGDFLDLVMREQPGLPRGELHDQLEAIAAEVTGTSDDADVSDSDAGRESQATLLVHHAEDLVLFRTPGGFDAEAYAVIKYEKRRDVLKVDSRPFKFWLSGTFYRENGKVPGAQALADATNAIQGQAFHDGDEQAIAVRIARAGDTTYIDLGDEQRNVVEIRGTGWRVVPNLNVPVNFVRKRGMLALPVPVSGGNIEELRPLLNAADEMTWILIKAFLVGAMRESGPFTILRVEGEQGSAKSTTCKMIRALLDPHIAPLRRPPSGERDLMISASNTRVMGFDNLSGLSPSLSDALCSLATGGAFSTRELFTDDEERHFSGMRPCIMNGIDDGGGRADLLDRCICLTLPRISPARRRPEDELWAEFNDILPRVLGALLDAASHAEANIATVVLSSYPRMADFAKWVVASTPALGFTEEEFISAFTENRVEADRVVVETSPIGPTLLLLLENGLWSGTASKLREALVGLADDATKRASGWPKNDKEMGHRIRRLAPSLRAIGVEVELDERDTSRQRNRLISLWKTPAITSETSTSSEPVPSDIEAGDSGGDSGGAASEASVPDRTTDPAPRGTPTPMSDDVDVSDVIAGGTPDEEEFDQWEG